MSTSREQLLRLAIIFSPSVFVSFGAGTVPDAATILERFRQGAERQKSDLCSYSVKRTYSLTNKHLSQEAKMIFSVTYDKSEGKKFKLISEENTNTLIRHSILDLISGEVASAGSESDKSQLDEANYKLWLIGQETTNGHSCYKIRLDPRNKGKYLLDGYAWIDTNRFTLVKMKGKPAKSVSFWASHPDFEQDFGPIHTFWLPTYNHSVAHITFFGDTSLAIEYGAYETQACSSQPSQTAEER